MTIYNQPDAVAFASDPKPSEIATFTAWARGLGIAFDETSGMPQMEGFNDILNRITQGIKYLEQYGIPLWRSDLEYPVGASVVYNGIQYRCIAQNTNAQPDLSQNSWQSAIVDNLTSTSTTQALSANQGRILSSVIKVSGKSINIGGVIIKWGVGVASNGEKIAFEAPFPNSLSNVVITDRDGSSSCGYNESLSNKNLFSFTSTTKTVYISWLAIGN